ncbi:hypothetical protein FKM82_026831 [Ascaphus truei]
MKPLQNNFLQQWNGNHKDTRQRILLHPHTKEELKWWEDIRNLGKGQTLHPVQWERITTDASNAGWGAQMGETLVQGTWINQEQRLPSNLLELKAVQRALEAFQDQIRDGNIKIDIKIVRQPVGCKVYSQTRGNQEQKADEPHSRNPLFGRGPLIRDHGRTQVIRKEENLKQLTVIFFSWNHGSGHIVTLPMYV